MSAIQTLSEQQASRAILHLDLDSFFISVERLRDSRLKGIPLVVGGKNGRGVVASCSYEARKFGVHSAMPMKLAHQLCPELKVISGDMEAYSQYSRMVTDIISERAPLFEKSSIDEFYLDLTGMDRFFGTSSWSGELRETIIREIGLPISCGLSVNKMVSKVATGEAKPNGKLHVPGGTERGFLDPLSISKIPLIGDKTFRLLRGMGIDRVRTLRKVPIELMQQMLGKNGTLLWKRANGIDQSAVVPFSEAKSISTERTFQQDTMDIRWLKSLLTSMLEKITFQLRDSKRLAGCLTVKIRYTSFDTYTRQLKLPYTASDHVLLARALELFDKLYDRRMRLRLIGVRLSDLVHGHHQIDLFEDSHEMVRLYQAMDCIRSKYGQHKLYRATGQGMVSDKRMVNAFARD